MELLVFVLIGLVIGGYFETREAATLHRSMICRRTVR